MFFGFDINHLPLKFSSGFLLVFFSTVKSLILELVDLAIMSKEPKTGSLLKPFNGISIFDCPDAIQTSPIRTFLKVTVCLIELTEN